MPDDFPSVLLVEEDAILAEVAGFRLELLGFRVRTAGSGEEALLAVERELADAMVLDLALPDMDGIELIHRLTSDERTSAVPILALSTSGDLDEVQRAHAAGAKDCLVIPFDPTMLEKKLEELLRAIGTSL